MAEAASDPHDLARFRDAQDRVWPAVMTELRAGGKRTHWSWFVFPQITGLSRSAMGARYAVRSIAEARAYLADPVLGPRLAEAVGAMLEHRHTPPGHVLGDIDAAKFRSCLTLFEAAATGRGQDAALLAEALEALYGGERCRLTLDRL
ncbi:MAG: DUF1810 family protein, partial [Pseudomonadota bacterium]